MSIPTNNGHGNGTAGRNTNKNNKNTANEPNGHIAQNKSQGNGVGYFGRR